MCKDVISPMYYQLQFIFDKLDKACFHIRFIEICLTVIRKISQIKVPKYETLAANIIPKNIALIEQKKRFNEFQKIDQNEILKNCIVDEETNEREILIPNPPETFDERQYKRTLKLQKSNKVKIKGPHKLSSAEDFWNFNDKLCSFNCDVLFKGSTNQFPLWKKIFDEYKKYCFENTNTDPLPLFDTIKSQNQKLNLYKFFIYNEKNNKWEKNSSSIEKLFADLNIKALNTKTPLILFSHSNEKDLITLSSKLIQHSYPDLDDDQIYIYALCDKSLSLLNYRINITKIDSTKKPIFLLLHVPESKKKLQNIKSICYQIYFFLSFICDIEVVVLNKENFTDQITLLENINNIKNMYLESSDSKKINQNENININDENSNESANDFSSDGDEIENFEEKEDFNQNKDDIFSQINQDLLKNKSKLIVLFNYDSINKEYKIDKKIDFIKDTKEKLDEKNCYFNFININNSISYNQFLTTLNELTSKYTNLYDEVLNKFDLYKIAQISGVYILLRFENQFQTSLEVIVKKRFDLLKEFDELGLRDYDILLNLHNEIVGTFPSLDDVYNAEYNAIINKIKNDRSQKNSSVVREELQISSDNNLEYLDQIKKLIKKRNYLTDNLKRNMKVNHKKFLNNEYFCIISAISSEKDCSSIFEGNISILEWQISNDNLKIDNLFVETQVNKNDQNVVDFDEQKTIGTNYMIRERENVREIKAIVQINEFNDVFEDDC